MLAYARRAVTRQCGVQFPYQGDGADETPSTLFPGVRELLDWLLQRGYLLAVATGKSRWDLDSVLGDTGLAGRFHIPGAPMRLAPNPIRRCCCKSWMNSG